MHPLSPIYSIKCGNSILSEAYLLLFYITAKKYSQKYLLWIDFKGGKYQINLYYSYLELRTLTIYNTVTQVFFFIKPC